jgi:GT2 family glycosyltransferase
MKLSVQLVTWNGAKYIPSLFESLKKQTFADWKLYILDNNSTDNTVELLKQELSNFSIQYELEEGSDNIGFAKGQNMLLKKHNAEYFVCLNQDLVLEPECFKKMVECMDNNKEVGSATPRLMKWILESDKESFSDEIDSLGLQVFKNRRVVEWYGGQNWSDKKSEIIEKGDNVFGVSGTLPIYRSSAIKSILDKDNNFFDPEFNAYKEDVDVAYRLKSAGWRAKVIFDAVAYHRRTGFGAKHMNDFSASKNKRKKSYYINYNSYKNHLMTLYKNEYWQNFILDFPFILWYEFRKFIWFLLFDTKVLKGLKEVISSKKELKSKRKAIIQNRKLNWRQMRKEL